MRILSEIMRIKPAMNLIVRSKLSEDAADDSCCVEVPPTDRAPYGQWYLCPECRTPRWAAVVEGGLLGRW